MSQVLRYHVVACQQLLLENLKMITNATTLQGEPIFISVSQVRAATSEGSCPPDVWLPFPRVTAAVIAANHLGISSV